MGCCPVENSNGESVSGRMPVSKRILLLSRPQNQERVKPISIAQTAGVGLAGGLDPIEPMGASGRRLTTIMAADIVGYSRLTGADEEGTLATLRALRRDLINRVIEQHHGRVIKRMGDGLLVEFASTVEAVRCAVAFQQAMAARNAGEQANKRIDFRVGINCGDVMVEDDGDLLGDAVNIAARLEGVADAGGIALSEDAWRQTRGKIGIEFIELGERTLKNIAMPVRVYAAPPAALSAPTSSAVMQASHPPPDDTGAGPSHDTRRARAGIFAKRGDYWAVAYQGRALSLRDIRGLAYIQRLLQHPGQLFHALDLAGGAEVGMTDLVTDQGESERLGRASEGRLAEAGMHRGGLGDAGEMLDAEAKRAYGRRLAELREELDEAKEAGDEARGDRIEDEIDALLNELKRAVGLGGRDRKARSASERARLNVTRAIKVALGRITAHHAELGGLLSRTIRTGTFCRYTPDPQSSVDWQFSATEQPIVGMEAPTPLVPPTQALSAQFPFGLADRTTFVGRENERNQLRACLRQAQGGHGCVVMIGGAAGVGKTRLAAEIAAEGWKNGVRTLAGRCYDTADSLPYGPFVEVLEALLASSLPEQAIRQTLGRDAPEIARLLPQLRRRYPDIPPPLQLAAEQSRRLLFGAVTQLLTRAVRTAPILLLLDDLHWAEEGSLQLLNHLARYLPNLPMLIVGTYRDFELNPAGSLASTLDELIRLHLIERITISGLPQSAVTEMLCELSGIKPTPRVASLFYSYTEGNPFFVEELARHLIEQGRLNDPAAEFRPPPHLTAEDVPQSVRLVIERRLVRLGEATQRILGMAAVIGRSFSFDVLAASTGADPDSLLDSVEEAERAGLISVNLGHREEQFQFSHELVRQTALGMLSEPRRRRHHLDIAHAIERVHAGTLGEHANDLAHHLSQAGSFADPDKTVNYLGIAAHRELEQSAYESALGHLRIALEMLRKFPDARERAEQELQLQMDCGIALGATKGWQALDVATAFRRARELCQGPGHDESAFSAAFGLWSFHVVRGELPMARSYAEEMIGLAQRTQDDAMLVRACWALGNTQFFMGEFAGAHSSFEEAIRRYQPQEHRLLASAMGQDPCMSSLCWDAMTLWTLGYPEQAEKRASESLALARKLGYPFTLAFCLNNIAIYHTMRRSYAQAEALIDESLGLSRDHGFAQYELSNLSYRAIVLGFQRKFKELKASPRPPQIDDAVLSATFITAALAESFGNSGKIDTALILLARAAGFLTRNEERFVESELARIKGELEMRQIDAGSFAPDEIRAREAEAERCFREAIEIAGRQGAKAFQLRAAISLSRLYQRWGRREDARRALGEIYESFTEGLDTPDHKEAHALLLELVDGVS